VRLRHILPLLAGIVLFGFLVRVLRLDFVNFHSDEASFIRIAYQGTLLQATATDDPHPPLFLALLQAWMGLAGISQYAIRFLPVLYGTLLIPTVYKLGRLIGSRGLGRGGAFVAASNPAFIYYAKEVRDYGLVAFTGALSFVLLLLAYRRPKLLPAYILAALAALASHYYAISIVALQLAILAALLARAGQLRPWPWLAAPIALVLAYTPWLLYARSAIGTYNLGAGSLQLAGDVLAQTVTAFTFGFALHPNGLLWPAIGVAVLVLLGLFALTGRASARFPVPNPHFPIPPLALTLAYIAAPIAFGLLTLVRQSNFAPRYLFAGAPAYALLLGAGLLLLWRWHWSLGGAGCALLLGLTGLTIRNVDFSAEFQPNGYRELAAYLGQHARPTDSVVLDGVSQWPLYFYYGQLRTHLPQRVEFLPRDTPSETEQAVITLLANGGVWYVESDVLRYDPRKDTERLLATNGYQALDTHFAGQRLEYFAGSAAGPLTPMSATAGPLQLTAVTRAAATIAPGQAIGAELDWLHGAGLVPPFKLSLRLEDASGVMAQNDTLPLGGYLDFAGWPTGQVIHDRAGLLVPPTTPPGTYQLKAVAYDAATVQGFGPPIDLGTVTVG
jgi:hypothetical protein